MFSIVFSRIRNSFTTQELFIANTQFVKEAINTKVNVVLRK